MRWELFIIPHYLDAAFRSQQPLHHFTISPSHHVSQAESLLAPTLRCSLFALTSTTASQNRDSDMASRIAEVARVVQCYKRYEPIVARNGTKRAPQKRRSTDVVVPCLPNMGTVHRLWPSSRASIRLDTLPSDWIDSQYGALRWMRFKRTERQRFRGPTY